MLETVIAMDIGSAWTRLASRAGVLEEESRAAIDPGNSSRILAFGSASRGILGASEAYPVRGGVADIQLTALMIRRFALRLLKRRTLLGVSALVAVPGAAGGVARAAFIRAAEEAGFARVRLVNSLLAGALGAGEDIASPNARMVVDIGREVLSTSIMANGGTILETSSRFGSAFVESRLRAYIAETHNLLITARTAEELKKELSKPLLRVGCRDIKTGFPAQREFCGSELRLACEPALKLICGEIASAINSAPPDAAADLLESGITLIGGGAEQYGLPEYLEGKLGVPVRRANNAASSTVAGMKTMLSGSSAAFPLLESVAGENADECFELGFPQKKRSAAREGRLF